MEQAPLGIHHVGIAVPSIDDAMHFYGDTLGMDLVDSVELPERQLKVAFVQAANTLIELLEPTDPDSTVSRFLERRGPGLHHLCFGTPDIREHLRDLKGKGVELIDEAPRPGAHGEVAFLQPSAALGVLVELLQPLAAKAAEADATTEAEPQSETEPQSAAPEAKIESEPEPKTGPEAASATPELKTEPKTGPETQSAEPEPKTGSESASATPELETAPKTGPEAKSAAPEPRTPSDPKTPSEPKTETEPKTPPPPESGAE